jgi:hypothetical protein
MGSSAETAGVGYEGVLGISLFMGGFASGRVAQSCRQQPGIEDCCDN